MAKSKGRKTMVAIQQANWENWKTMTPEKRKEWSERRIKTAKSGFTKRARERATGVPMASRSHEGLTLRGMAPPHSRPDPMFAWWLADFHRMTA